MIVFRTDGNPQIGAGHIMRCLAIANKAVNNGENCMFIASSNHFHRIITDNGHRFINLKSNYSSMELGDVFSFIDTYEPSVVFVDSYFITEKYLSTLHDKCQSSGSKLVYIDDRCLAPYCCDFLLNYNIFASFDDYKKIYCDDVHPAFMLGVSYVPLRNEFQNNDRRRVSQKAKSIFVSTGGADSEHLTIDIVEKALETTKYDFHFVVGMMNADRDKILEIAQKGQNIIIHENVNRMNELMSFCDVAISAAGSTLYELCATQTPSVTYVLADNQIRAAEEFNAKGIMKNCGDIRLIGNKKLASELIKETISLAEDYEIRKRISENMFTIVDGDGTNRILKRVLK